MSARTRDRVLAIVLGLLLATAVGLEAQGRGNGHGKGHGNGGGGKGRGAKHERHVVTTDHAVVVTRDFLVERGYTVVRVERVGADRVVYYHRGNNGRGRGRGPLEKIVVRPSGDRVIFVDSDPGITVDLRVRLNL